MTIPKFAFAFLLGTLLAVCLHDPADAMPQAAAAPPHAANPPAAKPAPADAGAAGGSDQISAERPGFTNGTDTVSLGHFQLETGFLLSTTGGVTQSHLNDGGQLRKPLSPNTEIRIVMPEYYFGGGSEAGTGFTDAGVTYKWRFLEETPGRRPSLAVITGTTVPSGSPSLRANHLQPMLDVEGQLNLSPLYQLQASTSYTRATDSGVEFNQFAGAVNISYNLSPITTPFLELYRVSPSGAGGAPNTNYLDGGMTYILGSNIQLDVNAGVGIGLNGNHFVGAGFAQRW